jgi:hypothetical protein
MYARNARKAMQLAGVVLFAAINAAARRAQVAQRGPRRQRSFAT